MASLPKFGGKLDPSAFGRINLKLKFDVTRYISLPDEENIVLN